MPQSHFSKALWIASSLKGSPQSGVPAPYVRTRFTVKGAIRSATLHCTALGLYECEINGQRVGDLALAPGWTDYHKRLYFQTYDVTALLQSGENVIGALLGDGWYCGFVGWGARQVYGDRPRFLAQLEIEYSDGSRETIATNNDWKTSTSPILQNDLLQGEAYDARLVQHGWSSPRFDDAHWEPVETFAVNDLPLETPPGPPVRRIETLTPISTVTLPGWPEGQRIFDFGQNFTGRVCLTVKATRGRTVKLRHAEILKPDGTIYTENLRGARATDFYTCAGDGEEIWEPLFTFHGFRYVEVSGLQEGESAKLVGYVLHSDMPPTGKFSCSHPLLTTLQSNIVWGQKGNFLDVPTDCPQRDERLGWTGDAQVFIRTAAFNMDVRGFFHKWLRDLGDAQKENGGVPPVAPDPGVVGGIVDGGPAWSDAMIICPWTIYLCYGDIAILKANYDAMQRYMAFTADHRCRDFIRSHPDVDQWGGFGDWLALDGSSNPHANTASDLIGTAFYAYDASIMAQVATLLDCPDDAARYTHLHQEIVSAFRERFVTKAGLVAGATQTSYVLALQFGLIPEEGRATAVKTLVRDIERRDFHLATGFVGTPYLLDVLTENGRLDVAYRLLEQESFPSWLFPVKNGATTIWERWDGWTPEKGFQDVGMNSFNHYAYGAVGAWMYRVMAGLDLDPAAPGYAHIIFRPRPGGTITWAEASLQTAHGEAAIRWDLKDGKFLCIVTIPEGARGTFYPPVCGEQPLSLEPGSHSLSWIYPKE